MASRPTGCSPGTERRRAWRADGSCMTGRYVAGNRVYCGGSGRGSTPRCQGQEALVRIIRKQSTTQSRLGGDDWKTLILHETGGHPARVTQNRRHPGAVAKKAGSCRMERGRPKSAVADFGIPIPRASREARLRCRRANPRGRAPQPTCSRITAGRPALMRGYKLYRRNLNDHSSTFSPAKCWRCPRPQARLAATASARVGQDSLSAHRTSSIQHWEKIIYTAERSIHSRRGMGGPRGPVEGPVVVERRRRVFLFSDIHPQAHEVHSTAGVTVFRSRPTRRNGLTRDLEQGRCSPAKRTRRASAARSSLALDPVYCQQLPGRRLQAE